MRKIVQKISAIGTLICLLTVMTNISFAAVKKEHKVIESKNMKDMKETQMDINTASKEEMVAHKITIKVANGILDYREVTGGFHDVSELKRINGVGTSTYNAIRTRFKVDSKIRKKHFNINKADKKTLLYFGLSKKEISEIEKYMKKNGRIRNNIDLMEILPRKRYEEYRSIVIYENFNM